MCVLDQGISAESQKGISALTTNLHFVLLFVFNLFLLVLDGKETKVDTEFLTEDP